MRRRWWFGPMKERHICFVVCDCWQLTASSQPPRALKCLSIQPPYDHWLLQLQRKVTKPTRLAHAYYSNQVSLFWNRQRRPVDKNNMNQRSEYRQRLKWADVIKDAMVREAEKGEKVRQRQPLGFICVSPHSVLLYHLKNSNNNVRNIQPLVFKCASAVEKSNWEIFHLTAVWHLHG